VSYIRRQDLAATQMADTIQDVKRIAPCVISPRLERGAGPRPAEAAGWIQVAGLRPVRP
jgi:hypothetical protein